jgi:hypothetical protein
MPNEEGAAMTATLNDQTGRKKRPEPSAEAKAAAELVRAAKESAARTAVVSSSLRR